MSESNTPSSTTKDKLIADMKHSMIEGKQNPHEKKNLAHIPDATGIVRAARTNAR